jgi:hypothetical protein
MKTSTVYSVVHVVCSVTYCKMYGRCMHLYIDIARCSQSQCVCTCALHCTTLNYTHDTYSIYFIYYHIMIYILTHR